MFGVFPIVTTSVAVWRSGVAPAQRTTSAQESDLECDISLCLRVAATAL